MPRAYGRGRWQAIDVGVSEDDLAELNSALQHALERVRRTSADGIELEAGTPAAEEARAGLDDDGAAGNAAFKRVFPRAEDRQTVRQALAEAEPAGVEVSSDRFLLPWELLYDRYEAGAASFSNFWGLRYNISRVLTAVRQAQSPVMRQARPRIALFADPSSSRCRRLKRPTFAGCG